MGRLEMTCRRFRFGGGGDDETRGHESSLCESAAAEIVHGLLPPGQDVGLKRGEGAVVDLGDAAPGLFGVRVAGLGWQAQGQGRQRVVWGEGEGGTFCSSD